MLDQIELTAGARPGSPPTKFSPDTMTIFVGPNNSGKSLALQELETVVVNSGFVQPLRIVSSVHFAADTPEDIDAVREAYRGASIVRTSGGSYLRAVHPFEDFIFDIPLDPSVALPVAGPVDGLRGIARLMTARLDGATRLRLLDDRPAHDLLHAQNHLLGQLFTNTTVRHRISAITVDAFGLHFVIDPTGMQVFRAKMSRRQPANDHEEESLGTAAREFFGQALPLGQVSDGVRAFTGIVAAALTGHFRLILLDEPEAFLHPSLIRRLGHLLCDLAAERRGHVIAATHSADFLLGTVGSGRPVNVVRLTYDGCTGNARILPSDVLRTLMRDPLLRSARVLAALFHSGAIICEADSDRAFYEEVNIRLAAATFPHAKDTFFINGHGKDMLAAIARPLRELGLPAAVIVDLDIINTPDSFRKLLIACQVPQGLVQTWGMLRGTVLATFERQGASLKRGGVTSLDRAGREEAESLISVVAEYGIFIVPTGEVESWLPELSIAGHGPEWLGRLFDRMGSDPLQHDYVKPTPHDVWSFLGRVATWLANGSRKGVA